jgi:hypothetical protein
MDYEPGLCDLVRAIDLTLIALVEPEADVSFRLLLKTRSEWRPISTKSGAPTVSADRESRIANPGFAQDEGRLGRAWNARSLTNAPVTPC